jgi:large subunit ribosomal protein L7Ae
MVKGKGKKGQKVPRKTHPLFESRPKNFGIGGDVRPKQDLTRYVRWPKYIQIQRQKRILMSRIKVPAIINQFSKTLETNQHNFLFKLLNKYRPESPKEKEERLKKEAEAKKDAPEQKGQDFLLKYGLNHVTYLIESGKAKLVVIAGDVEPIELVVWLPQLCLKMGVAYCFVRSKAELGNLIHMKTASCLCLTGVRKEDANDFESLVGAYKKLYNENEELRRKDGGGNLGVKSSHKMANREKARELDEIRKAK